MDQCRLTSGIADAGRCYRVGRDRAGSWLAMEAGGRNGGMFATREAALHYAGSETRWRRGAVNESAVVMRFG